MSYLSMGYFGQAETPDVKPLPWKIDAPPTEAELKAQKASARWEKTTMVVGILGGVLGIILSWRALRGSK